MSKKPLSNNAITYGSLARNNDPKTSGTSTPTAFRTYTSQKPSQQKNMNRRPTLNIDIPSSPPVNTINQFDRYPNSGNPTSNKSFRAITNGNPSPYDDQINIDRKKALILMLLARNPKTVVRPVGSIMISPKSAHLKKLHRIKNFLWGFGNVFWVFTQISSLDYFLTGEPFKLEHTAAWAVSSIVASFVCIPSIAYNIGRLSEWNASKPCNDCKDLLLWRAASAIGNITLSYIYFVSFNNACKKDFGEISEPYALAIIYSLNFYNAGVCYFYNAFWFGNNVQLKKYLHLPNILKVYKTTYGLSLEILKSLATNIDMACITKIVCAITVLILFFAQLAYLPCSFYLNYDVARKVYLQLEGFISPASESQNGSAIFPNITNTSGASNSNLHETLSIIGITQGFLYIPFAFLPYYGYQTLVTIKNIMCRIQQKVDPNKKGNDTLEGRASSNNQLELSSNDYCDSRLSMNSTSPGAQPNSSLEESSDNNSAEPEAGDQCSLKNIFLSILTLMNLVFASCITIGRITMTADVSSTNFQYLVLIIYTELLQNLLTRFSPTKKMYGLVCTRMCRTLSCKKSSRGYGEYYNINTIPYNGYGP